MKTTFYIRQIYGPGTVLLAGLPPVSEGCMALALVYVRFPEVQPRTSVMVFKKSQLKRLRPFAGQLLTGEIDAEGNICLDDIPHLSRQ